MHKRFLLIALVVTTGLALFYHFGRSLWHPVYLKFAGGRTVSEVVAELEAEGHNLMQEEVVALQLLAFKEERQLEVWGRASDAAYNHLDTYPFTGFSGKLGPKLREGDGQIPEGLYRIEYLNPNSSYHLSMKVDYPNAFDRAKGAQDGRKHLGFDIFIHGKSVTVGCIPIGDANIEKLFHLVATVGKENVDVIIAPYDMRKEQRELKIEGIDWEAELYADIQRALEAFKTR